MDNMNSPGGQSIKESIDTALDPLPYSVPVREYFERPRGAGSLPEGDPQVGTAVVGARVQGSIVRLQVRIAGDTIRTACFKAHGCGFTIAAASWVCEWARGRTVTEACLLDDSAIAAALDLPPAKIHCAVLAARALRAAVVAYRARAGAAGATG